MNYPDFIYELAEQWGSKTCFFLNDPPECEIWPSEEFIHLGNGVYQSSFYENNGYDFYKLVSMANPKNIEMKYLGHDKNLIEVVK